MLNRRQFLTRTLQGSSLFALSSVVPNFIASTARAAEVGKDTILVVIEMTGGNDGLNTVIPFGDDLYQKNRPTLKYSKDQVVKVNDTLGLNPGLRAFDKMLENSQLAIVQGVGYPNPDRSHFESMDIWHSADPKRQLRSGWIGRSATDLQDKKGNVPIMHIGSNRLPLALQGTGGGAISVNSSQPYKLELGGGDAAQQKARKQLLQDLAEPAKDADENSLLNFVQRRQVQTLTTLERLEEVLKGQAAMSNQPFFSRTGQIYGANSLPQKLQLVAALIQKGFGTRVFYVPYGQFDTHSNQKDEHFKQLSELADGVFNFYEMLKNGGGHDKRVRVMTFSEFGRRVQENGSKGTDHGSGSCLFVAGPSFKNTVIGDHPSLSDLDSGDLKYHTDFRRVYATLLDAWLGVDSNPVLSGKFEHLEGLLPKA
jgi:uncharacterized protein (DUF1501 family)